MEQYTTISDSYVIDKTFTIQGEENGRLRIDPNENGTPFFIQDLVPKMRKRIILTQPNICFLLHCSVKSTFRLKILRLFKTQFVLKNIQKN